MARVGVAYVEIHGDLTPLKNDLRLLMARPLDQDVKVKGDLSSLNRDLDVTRRKFDSADGSLGKFNKSMLTLRNTVGIVKWPAFIAGAGFAAQALSSLTAGTVALTGAVVPLSGALVAYPALLGAVGQGAGVVALAGIKDLTEAMGGNEDAMKRLTPQAQAFLKTLQSFKPRFDALRSAVQRPLFAGLTEGLRSAVGNLPVLRRGLVQTASSLGDLGARMGRLLGSSGFGRDFGRIMGRNALTLHRLGRSVINLGSALRHVLVAADPLIGFMTKAILSGSRLAETFAKQGRATGRMGRFFAQTRDVMKTVGSIGKQVAIALYEIGRAGAPLGRTILRDINKEATEFRKWTQSLAGKNQLRDFFQQAKGPLYETVGLVSDLTKAFLRIGTGEGVTKLVASTRTLVPVLESVIASTTTAFGPALVDTLRSVVVLFGDLAGTSGPLTVYVRTLGLMADVLHELLTTVPGLKLLVVSMVGLHAVSKSLTFFGAITGVKTLLPLMRSLVVVTLAARLEQAKWVAGLALQRTALLGAAAATRVQTVAQLGLNAALRASPYVAAATALGLSAFLIVKHWERIKRAAMDAINFVKSHPYVIPGQPFAVAAIAIVNNWKKIRDAATDTFGALRSGAGGAFGAVSSAAQRMGAVFGAVGGRLRGIAAGPFKAIKDAIKAVIEVLGKLVGIAKRAADAVGNIKFPDIPGFAKGGIVKSATTLVGEEGPELVKYAGKTGLVGAAGPEIRELPVGTRVYSHPETKRKLSPLIQKVSRVLDGKALPGVEAVEGSQGRLGSRGLGARRMAQRMGIRAFAKGGTVTPREVSSIASKWNVNRAVASIAAAVAEKFRGMKIISGYRPGSITSSGNVSNHSKHAALDLGTGTNVSLNRRIGTWTRAQFSKSLRGVTEDVLDIDHDPNPPDHADHVHVAAIGQAIAKAMSGAGGDGPGEARKVRRITGSLSLGQMVTLAKRAGFPDPALAAAVGYAESKGKVGAVGDGGDSLGLWQIHTPSHPKYDHAKLQGDALYNAKAALAISKGGKTFKPWSVYNRPPYPYKQYLGAKGKPLPKGTTRGTPTGSSKADYLTMRLHEAESDTPSDPKDDIRWINRALRYWRGVRKRNKSAGNHQRADEALSQIDTLKEKKRSLREGLEDEDLFTLGGLEKIGKDANAFPLKVYGDQLANLELDKANAALTFPPDNADDLGALKASLQDDIAAASKIATIWEGLKSLADGFFVPSPEKGQPFKPTKSQQRALDKTKNPTERTNLLNRFIAERDRGTFIQGTLAQKTEATTNLGTAKSELRSLLAEINKTPEAEEAAASSNAKEEIRAFMAAIGDLNKTFGSNFRPLQSFAEGGIIQGPRGKKVVIEGHGGEAVINEDGNLTVTIDPKQLKEVLSQSKVENKYIDARATFATAPADPHTYSRNVKHELDAI